MEPLDKDVVNLTKAIRQVESGGKFDARSKDGSYGAYQFIKPTWDATAKKFGINAEWEKATPEQQNEVAYKQIKEWKDKGYNVGQISSMWNAGAGRPNAYLEGLKGVNKDGVAYNVAKYAEKVATNYHRIKGATQEVPPATEVSTETPEAPQENKVKGGFIGNLLTGSTQRFGRTIGESLAAPKNAELYSQALGQNTEIANNLRKRIKEKKSKGEDVTRLQNALDQLVKDTPQLEQFTGSVINKTPGQVLGEAGGTALEMLSGGTLGGGVKALASKSLPALGKIKQAAKLGAIYGGIGGATTGLQKGDGATGAITEGLKGAAVGGVLGGGIGAIGAGLASKAGKRAASLAIRKENVTGQILQGTIDDIPKGQKVLNKLDTKGVKTYEDLGGKLEKKVEELSAKQDKVLDMDLAKRKLNSLQATMKVGEKEVKYNYVKDALAQLKDYYTKTNNQVKKFEIAQLEKRAAKEGLTNKEINNIAKLHGRELSAFNVNGQLASGLTKQAAENTRAGVKSTVRELSGNKASKAIDQEIASTIRVKDLVQKQTEKVNELQQKIQAYGLGEKIGRKVFQVANLFTGGGLKGAVGAALPRGVGYKTLNAIDLEQSLQKNLKLLNKLTEKQLSKETFLETLDKFLNQSISRASQSSNSGKSQANIQQIALRSQKPTKINTKTSINKLPNKPPKLK